MSITDMMKIQGVDAAGRVTSRDQGQVDARNVAHQERAEKPQVKSGLSVEIAGKVDAGEAPVQADRVEEIRKALRDGRYPIVPAQIADAMIAARLEPVVAS